MKQIQIACVPADWDESTITAIGMLRNERKALPVTTIAKELPEQWLAVWHGLVNTLKGVAPGEWAATFITAELVIIPNIVEGEEEIEETQAIQLTIHRQWDDCTTADPISMDLADAPAIAFFEWLTQDS